MKKIDFLSEAPKPLIFEQGSNKTAFGGVMTILYLIILFMIITIYMYDFIVNPKFSVLYSYEHYFKPDEESINERYNNTDLNPKITFNLKMSPGINESHFGVLYLNNETKEKYKVEFGKDYTENLYDLVLMIVYRCNNNTDNTTEGNCELHDDEKEHNKILNSYRLIFNYTGNKVDHQNSHSPLKKTFIQNNFFFSIEEKISFNYLRWKTIKYIEDKGILSVIGSWFNIQDEFYGGSFMDPAVFNLNIPEKYKIHETKRLKILGIILINQNEPNNYIDLYSRTRKFFIDAIAEICSLSLTFFEFFKFFYGGYYSNNFDSYKIVKKILSNNGKPYVKINERKELLPLSNDSDRQDSLLESNIINNENNDENIIDNDNEEEENIVDDISEQNESKIHSKFHFYDFLYNNFYFEKCCNSNKQNFISTCNEIVSRYNSVDYIIYNLIKMENLFKDYKWNDPNLKDIRNNQSFMDLNLLGL